MTKIPRQAMQEASLSDIGGKRAAVLCRDALSSTVKYNVPLEEIFFAPGDGNVEKITGITSFKYSSICDEYGVKLGSPGETSLSWAVGECLTEEVTYYPLSSLEDSEFLAKLTKGQYAVDYALGKLFYCKANNADSEYCSYVTRQQSLQIRTLCENQASWEVNVYTILSNGTGQNLPSRIVPNGMMLVVRAQPDNAGNIYLSHSKAGAESANNRIQLAAGQAITLHVANADVVWWDASAASQKIEVYVEVAS